MKIIFVLAILISTSVFAGSLKLSVLVNGKNVEDFNTPVITFVATNPLCLKATVLPLPAIYLKSTELAARVTAKSKNNLLIEFPLSHPAHICRYRFEEVSIGAKNRLEMVSIMTNKGFESQESLERNLMNAAKGAFEVEHSNGFTRILKNGSQIGYSSSNVGYLYLDHKTLEKSEDLEASLTISFK